MHIDNTSSRSPCDSKSIVDDWSFQGSIFAGLHRRKRGHLELLVGYAIQMMERYVPYIHTVWFSFPFLQCPPESYTLSNLVAPNPNQHIPTGERRSSRFCLSNRRFTRRSQSRTTSCKCHRVRRQGAGSQGERSGRGEIWGCKIVDVEFDGLHMCRSRYQTMKQWGVSLLMFIATSNSHQRKFTGGCRL